MQSQEVARLDSLRREKESESAAATLNAASSEGISRHILCFSKKMCNDLLWHFGDYSEYVMSMIEYWQVMDMKV